MEIQSLSTVSSSSPKARHHIYLIDGSGFIFRAYHALPPLSRADGTPVGAILGFCNILLKLLDSYEIDNIAVVFDSARANFRHEIFPAYKANRSETPENLIPQFPLFREACTAFNLPQIELPGYEADDIIATYCTQAVAQGHDVTIVSSDKDLMQLVNENVRMLDPLKNKFIGAADVAEKFGVGPDRVIDVQALAGDASDNIPGVPGIGVKTAALLINEFGDLETLLAQAHTIKQDKRRQSLVEHADKALLSQKLVRLATDAPLDLTFADLALHQPDPQILSDFLHEQGFHSLIGRLTKRGMIGEAKPSSDQPSQETSLQSHLKKASQEYTLVQSIPQLKDWLKAASNHGVVAFDTETTALNPTRAHLVGFSLSYELGKACYVPVGHAGEGNVPLDEAMPLLRDFLQNPALKIVGHNLKYDMRILLNEGIEIAAYEDTLVMSYVCEGAQQGHSLDALAQKHFAHTMISFTDVMDVLKKESGLKSPTFADVPLEKATAYAAEDADYTFRLYHFLTQRLHEKNAHSVYYSLDLPMVKILALMEHKGILVDASVLKGLSATFADKLQALATEIHGLAGRDFNIASPKQLGEVLFDELNLEAGKKSKTGAHSTSADILEKLAEEGHLLPQKVLEWRHYAKLKSTYIDSLPHEISPQTRRVHTSYGLAVTSTGRLSSSDPNLQNIPIRTQDGRQIRQAFVAQEGYKLVSLDYSQIELRLLAHMANLDSLRQAFKEGQDIHTATAAEIFHLPLADVTPEIRRSAKAINFGIIYGISAFGLARQLGISRSEAAGHIETYFQKYPGIQAYMEEQKNRAREAGFVETIFGRRCSIHGLHDTNPMRRAFAERQAINAPLQGSSADIIKRAMGGVATLLAPYNAGGTIKQVIPLQEPEKAPAQSDHPQLSFFGLDLPSGVTLGMPAAQPSRRSPLYHDGKECPMVGPYGSTLRALTGEGARLLLQVHDELIFEMREDLVEELSKKLQKLMQGVVYLSVPLVVDVGIGDNWDQAH